MTPAETRAFPNDPEANSAGEGTSGKGQPLIQTRRPPA
jgi:hypothetical protein